MLIRALRIAVCALAAAFALAAVPAHAQASEDAVKAAFLPKFVRYIELPAGVRPAEGQPFYLCLIGRDPFGPMLDRAATNETIGGSAIAIRRFPNAEVPAAAGCHVAFLAGSDQQTAQMLATMRRHPTLTVTDARWGGTRGMIHFVVAGGRVRFHIDNAAASSRGITISSRLLALAVDVRQRQ